MSKPVVVIHWKKKTFASFIIWLLMTSEGAHFTIQSRSYFLTNPSTVQGIYISFYGNAYYVEWNEMYACFGGIQQQVV